MNKPFLQTALPFLLLLFFSTACENGETDKTASITGLWIQQKITEDGEEIPLPDREKSLSLLIEPNGVYRTYAKDAPNAKEHFGVWTVTDDTWLEMTADLWRVSSGQWAKNHIAVRFTIMELSDNILEIRLKTYVGERKYSALFVEGNRPPVTADNSDEISAEYKELKTYIYTFHKE
jgi:hypothetical protein